MCHLETSPLKFQSNPSYQEVPTETFQVGRVNFERKWGNKFGYEFNSICHLESGMIYIKSGRKI